MLPAAVEYTTFPCDVLWLAQWVTPMCTWSTELTCYQWPRNWCQDVWAPESLRGIRAADTATKGSQSPGRRRAPSLVLLPVSFDTILAICARSLLSSSCSAVVRLSAVTPGFFSPSIRLPSRRKLGTEEFLWSTRRGVGRHSCFRGRVSLLKTKEFLRVISVSLHSNIHKSIRVHHNLEPPFS